MTVSAYIGIGSNMAGGLASPVEQVKTAFDAIDAIQGCECIARSSLYQSLALTPGQPDYINAVARVQTALDAHDLLGELQAIERAHDRVRTEHWGPRTLDLDILVYDELVIETEHLTVPHPGVREREFVVYPLLEIAPDLSIPGHGKLTDIAVSVPRRGLEKVGDAV